MSYDSSGNYSLPNGYQAVTGQTILASQHNPSLEDIAAALSQVLLRNGAAPMNANLPMAGFKMTGLGDGTGNNDAVNVGQIGPLAASATAAATTKSTPVAADFIPLVDTQASNALRKVLWSTVAPSARKVEGAGLATGGGALTADRTITVTAATQAEAEAGTSNTVSMTPLRTKQAIEEISIGYGQTWQNVTASRAGSSTSYQNATGRPIVVSIQSGTNGFLQVSVNGSSSWVRVADTSTAAGISISAVIPVGHYYRFTAGSFEYWAELR